MTGIRTARLGRDFNALWFGQTVSLFGSAVTMLALPTVAILTLHATPLQVGVLEALGTAAFPILGLTVGVLADRSARRPIMIGADIVRAVVLASILSLALAHRLAFVELAVATALIGIGSVFFEICYQSYLPSLVAAEQLPAANTRLEITRSAAQITGSGLAGALIAAIGAPMALGVDALSFVASTISLGIVRTREHVGRDVANAGRASFLAELREGVAVVVRSPVLRSISLCTATLNLGSSMSGAVFLIFAYRQLHVSPAAMGLVFALSNLGFVGAALATRAERRFGLGLTLAASAFVEGIVVLCLPLATIEAPLAVIFAVELLGTFLVPIYNVNQVSLRQAMVPLAMQGRMNATIRTIVWGTMPLGALAGGWLGGAIGIVPTILIAGGVASLGSLWIVASPAFRLRSGDAAPGMLGSEGERE